MQNGKGGGNKDEENLLLWAIYKIKVSDDWFVKLDTRNSLTFEEMFTV